MSDDRRASPRTKVHVELECEVGTVKGTAVLLDLSVTGALLDPSSIRPFVGDEVIVRFSDFEGEDEVFGEVVRMTDKGFAIQFSTSYSVVRHIILKYGGS